MPYNKKTPQRGINFALNLDFVPKNDEKKKLTHYRETAFYVYCIFCRLIFFIDFIDGNRLIISYKPL